MGASGQETGVDLVDGMDPMDGSGRNEPAGEGSIGDGDGVDGRKLPPSQGLRRGGLGP